MCVLCTCRARLAATGTFANWWRRKKMWEKEKSWEWSDTEESKKHCWKAKREASWLRKRKGWGGKRRMRRGGDEWRGKEQWLIDIENLCCCKCAMKGYQCKRIEMSAVMEWRLRPSFNVTTPWSSWKHQNREHTGLEDKFPDLSRPAPAKGFGWRTATKLKCSARNTFILVPQHWN